MDGDPDGGLAAALSGRCVFLEFKRSGAKPDPVQVLAHEDLRRHGARVEVVDSVEQFKGIIQEYQRGRES